MRSLAIIILAQLSLTHLFAQQPGLNQWREHISYKSAFTLAVSKNDVYCGNKDGLFAYNKNDYSIKRYSKVQGLSDIYLSAMLWNENYKSLVIGYANGNIDILKEHNITNIPDLKNTTFIGSKKVNNIKQIGEYTWLCTDFGIVLLDLKKNEIKDSYYLNEDKSISVLDVIEYNNLVYCATTEGIYTAAKDDQNLANYHNWTKDISLPQPDASYNSLVIFDNKLLTNVHVSTHNGDSLYLLDQTWNAIDIGQSNNHHLSVKNNTLQICHNYEVGQYDNSFSKTGNIYKLSNDRNTTPITSVVDADTTWIADQRYGLIRSWNTWNNSIISVEGPSTTNAIRLDINDGDLWVATGGRSGFLWQNIWSQEGLLHFDGLSWTTINKQQDSILNNVHDFISVTIDPKDKEHVFAATLGAGLIEIQNGIVTNIYDTANSSLRSNEQWSWIGISDMQFDTDNNLWIANTKTERALSVLTSSDEWQAYNLTSIVPSDEVLGDVLIANNNNIFVVLPNSGGIIVLDYNNTPLDQNDDAMTILSNANGKGNLPSNDVLSIAEDEDGEIWIGTTEGIGVIYSPSNIFDNGDYDAQKILIELDGYAQYLLETEAVSSIEVDGANRKWIGTEGAGLFYMSEDGTEEISHFTKDNSPLPSDNITDICIDPKSGEVFISTTNGIVSYRSSSTEGSTTFSSVYAFPNPVEAAYDGPIAITGLITNSTVKITDVSGNLVFETTSEGGQAIWNGNNYLGHKVSTGVYLVFAANNDGSQAIVTKILVLN